MHYYTTNVKVTRLTDKKSSRSKSRETFQISVGLSKTHWNNFPFQACKSENCKLSIPFYAQLKLAQPNRNNPIFLGLWADPERLNLCQKIRNLVRFTFHSKSASEFHLHLPKENFQVSFLETLMKTWPFLWQCKKTRKWLTFCL